MDSIDAGKGTMPDKSVVQSARKATRYVRVCVAFVISTFSFSIGWVPLRVQRRPKE